MNDAEERFVRVSVLFNEPKLLKLTPRNRPMYAPLSSVSVLFNEPKLLKFVVGVGVKRQAPSFSALQRAEIAEIISLASLHANRTGFSALQRAEIAEIWRVEVAYWRKGLFQCSSTSRNC